MKITSEYQPQNALHSVRDADSIPVGYASRLWKQLMPGDIQHRFNDTSEVFIGGAWKNVPQELVDEVLRHLLEDLGALKACPLTCKFLFRATRPLIHQWLMCVCSRRVRPKQKIPLLSCRKRDPGAFELLIDADRSGVLPYTRHLTFKPDHAYSYPFFNPRDLQEYLPHLQSIIKLHTLTLVMFHVSPFIPVFDEYFGMFANTLHHLDVRRIHVTARELSYIICQFPLLEDLTIVYPAGQSTAQPGDQVPMITQSPPLRGKLILVQADSRELTEGLAAFPRGLNFRSLQLYWSNHLEPIVAACGHTATSVSYLWPRGDAYGEPKPLLQVRTVM